MKIRAALVLGGLCVWATIAVAQPQPPAPPPMIPPPPTVPTPPAPPATPAAPAPPASEAAPPPPGSEPAASEEKKDEKKDKDDKDEKKEETPPYEFEILGKNEAIGPYTHGSAKVEEGKIDVATEKNTLTVTITGGAGANVFLGAHSEAMQAFRLVQEFEVKSTDTSISQVILSLDTKLLGFVRSKHKASACVNIASITVTPVGCAESHLAASLPRPCVASNAHPCADPSGSISKDPVPTITTAPLPLGRYVIEANFVIMAEASGVLDAHSTAIFSPEPKELDPWEREHDPYKGEDKAGYGFTSVLTATPVGATPQKAERVWEKNRKRLAKIKSDLKLANRPNPSKPPVYQQAALPRPDYTQAVAPQPLTR